MLNKAISYERGMSAELILYILGLNLSSSDYVLENILYMFM